MAGTASRASRRAFVASALAALKLAAQSQKGTAFPPEWLRYEDPTTEMEVVRLTDSAYSSALPAYYNRAVMRNNASLICGIDRTGQPQAFRIDLKTGEARQLTEVAELDVASLALSPDSHSFCCFAGRSLLHVMLGTLRQREIYRIPDGWERCPGMSLTPDGAHALFAERRSEGSRLRAVSVAQGIFRTVIEARFAIEHPLARPGRDQILYREAGEALWLVDSGGANNRRLELAPGRIGSALWSQDGKNVQYLNLPDDPAQLHAIREFSPDAAADRLVAKTSQFACFGANRDSSVFVGASANRSSPTILLLLRVTRREFTLCEHKASNPETVAPVFSPDSQRVLFQSDRDGHPAIYSVHVDKLVEPTDAEIG
ncbi:MAG: oligogalacturonate lyase family protein [Bryobacteraceae bacterium]|jgi:oligogalacturonide lyase